MIPAVPVLPPPPAVQMPAPGEALLAAGITTDPTTQAALPTAPAKKVNLNSTAASFAIKRTTTATTQVLPAASALSALRVSLGTSSAGVAMGSTSARED